MTKNKFGWNYRVYRYEDGSLGVHETYYNIEKDGDMAPSENAIIAGSETIDELMTNLETIARDIQKCKYDILPWESKPKRKAAPKENGKT